MLASSERLQAWNAVGVSFQVKELSTNGKMKYAALVNYHFVRDGAAAAAAAAAASASQPLPLTITLLVLIGDRRGKPSCTTRRRILCAGAAQGGCA
jgi:hypothetical protein